MLEEARRNCDARQLRNVAFVASMQRHNEGVILLDLQGQRRLRADGGEYTRHLT